MMTDAEKVQLARQTFHDLAKNLRESVDDTREIPEVLHRIDWVLKKLDA